MLNENALHALKALLSSKQVFTDGASLISYEGDAGMDHGRPDGIVFPHSPEDVVRVARWAAEYAVPLIARGAGTGLSGGAVADRGGIIVEFSHMNRVLELDEHGRSAIVEPGLINLRLDEAVRAKDLYFPPDPASQRASSIGGNVAENSGGPHCFKYGVTTNYVTGMEIVLADGRLAHVGGRALDFPEYDLCGLLTGSEGTLAMMTSIALRLVRNPPAVKTMLAVFDSVEQAGVAVSAIIATGLVPATMEMMDQKIIRIVEEYAHAGLPVEAEALLIVEVDGYPASLDWQVAAVSTLLLENGGRDLRVAQSEEERAQIWFARKSAAGAITRLTPAYYTVDITVPRSRLTEALAEVNQICDRYGLRVGYVFHAGDGNLHPLILISDPQDRELVRRVLRAGRETVEMAVRKGGSLTGEHGVGIEKREYMPLMYNANEMSAMADIKTIFDPHELLNPGKMFPLSSNTVEAQYMAPTGSSEAAIVTPAPTDTVGATLAVALGEAATLGNAATLGEAGTFTPTTAEEAAQMLRKRSDTGQPVYIQGRASDATSRSDGVALLSTSRLNGIQTYAPDDMYVTVGAGTLLAEIAAFLELVGRQMPLASPWPDATIGGIVATNVNAPLRMRYGSIRDLVLCATVALADGRVIRAGRPVMKNVAGYDLVKVFTGSHGTLGLIVDVTLKLVVQPRARRTLLIPLADWRYGLLWARELLPQALVASAIVVCKGSELALPTTSVHAWLAYTAEGLVEDVQAELDNVRTALRGLGSSEPIEVEAPSGTDLWKDLLGSPKGKLLARAGVPAKDVAAYMIDSADAFNQASFLADISNGLVYATIPRENMQEVRQWLEQMRQPALVLDGYAVIMDMPGEWEGEIDRWGYQPEVMDVMRRLKERWDPKGVLNPGVFITSLSSGTE